MRLCLLIGLLLLVTPAFAAGPVLPCDVDGPSGYAYIDGRSAYVPIVLTWTQFVPVHIDGVIAGGGGYWYDLKTLDNFGVRFDWPYYTYALAKGQAVTLVGRLDRAGHIQAAGVILR